MARNKWHQEIKPVHEAHYCVICGEICGFGFGPPGPMTYQERVGKTKWYCNEHKKVGEKAYLTEFPTQAQSTQSP